MFTAAIHSENGFDLRSLWVANTGASTGERFDELTSASGSILTGHEQLTYSTFEFDANGLTYRYSGSFEIDAYYGLLDATVAAHGSYDKIEVLSDETVVATYEGPSRQVDFGTHHVGLLDVVGGLLSGVLGLLFGSNAPARAYENLHYGATPDLYDLAFASGGDISGSDAADTIVGGFEADVINGGAGADVLAGRAGNDTYVVDDGGDQVVELLDQGNDTVLTSVSYTLGANVENLVITQGANLTAIGNALNNVLTGNDSANVLNGAAGQDVMKGLGGDDTYVVDNAGDQVTEAAGGGTDRVNASVNYTLASGQEIETLGTTSLAGTGAITLVGNSFAQTLYGNAGANTLNGAGGADTLQGFAGDDTYVVDNAGDQVLEAAGGGGADRVNASASYVLAGGQEVEILGTTSVAGGTAINLTGNATAQTVYGNAGANVLDGAAGADTLSGFGGADTFSFTTALGGDNIDHVTDFSAPADTIRLAKSIFSALSAGALDATAYKDIGDPGASVDADDRILYDDDNGALYYDANGSDAGGRTQFAILDNRPATLTHADFVVA